MAFSRKQFVIFLLLISTTTIGYWHFNPTNDKIIVYSTNKTISQLKSIEEKLIRNFLNKEPPSTEVMTQISTLLKDLDQTPSSTPTPIAKETTRDNQIVFCPEKWTPRRDYPFFITGWEKNNCSDAPVITNYTTIVLYGKCFTDIINGLRREYPKVAIVIAVHNKSSCEKLPSNVKKVVVDPFWTAGKILNTLTSHVITSTVLLGRNLNLYLPFLTPLERLLKVLSSNSQIKAAGGSIRNETGHWSIGCFQTKILNYILQFEDGYYKSENECMYCNHLISPFVTYTKLLLRMKFDETLDENSIFEDLFLRFAQEDYLMVNCPDVMFLANENWSEKERSRSKWIKLAIKWKLNRIVLPNVVLAFTCKDIGISCKYVTRKTSSFLIPICCVEQFAKAVHFFHDFATRFNLPYEVQDGTALGAVKMYDFIPWDIDGDFKFLSINVSVFRESVLNFSKNGLRIADMKMKYKAPYFTLYSPDLKLEMWGQDHFACDKFYPQIFKSNPTKVLFHGKWINGPINPAGYARNRFGVEMLRHSHNWSQLKLKSAWEPVKSGIFKKCIDPKNNACLDKFNTDGNIQFKVPMNGFDCCL